MNWGMLSAFGITNLVQVPVCSDGSKLKKCKYCHWLNMDETQGRRRHQNRWFLELVVIETTTQASILPNVQEIVQASVQESMQASMQASKQASKHSSSSLLDSDAATSGTRSTTSLSQSSERNQP
ncbi:hypothetical protein MSG28_009552 [Choristoneura fumiferana]|uniref:Uncharacterized protein n=1 Tax=Choristoneura fumiferana TaxID=7141 RepID=A0ACC0JBP2_CHOFU|nr:hypothetical protein MSG28_009552 [Choristoneura fumiferana]